MVNQTGVELNLLGVTKPIDIFHSDNLQSAHSLFRFLIIQFLVYSGFPTSTLCVTHHSSLIMPFDSLYWNGLQMRGACKFRKKICVDFSRSFANLEAAQALKWFERRPVYGRHILITFLYSANFLGQPEQDFYKTR